VTALPHNGAVDDRAWPSTAEALMRSRFAAFRDSDAEWLLASWHPSTRPATVNLASNPRWRGLQIVDVVDGTADDETGVVEFRATYVVAPGDVRVLHERSLFVREDGRWYYLGAESTGPCS
jgi:SEC-C motif domain protein